MGMNLVNQSLLESSELNIFFSLGQFSNDLNVVLAGSSNILEGFGDSITGDFTSVSHYEQINLSVQKQIYPFARRVKVTSVIPFTNWLMTCEVFYCASL